MYWLGDSITYSYEVFDAIPTIDSVNEEPKFLLRCSCVDDQPTFSQLAIANDAFLTVVTLGTLGQTGGRNSHL